MRNKLAAPFEVIERTSEQPAGGRNADQPREPLRVAIVAYCMLAGGGAEKQAFYIARELAQAGVKVRAYNVHGLSHGRVHGVHSTYEDALRRMNVESQRFGWLPGLPFRLLILLAALRRFRPHLIQSMHNSTNLYAAIAGRALGALSIGGLRNDFSAFLEDNRWYARSLLTWPDAIAVNSVKALQDVKRAGMLDPGRLHFLPNAIDLSRFPDRAQVPGQASGRAEYTCICVTRLQPLKRVDVFLRALADARTVEPGFRGIVVGFGPEEGQLRQLAATLGLLPDAVSFLGYRNDVAALLQQADMFVFCSESEGTPNVVLEAMAAGLPVITTPAGDATDLVEPAGAGYVVPFGDVNAVTEAMLRMARSAALREKLGRAGRNYIAQERATSALAGRLLQLYAEAARASRRKCAEDLLKRVEGF